MNRRRFLAMGANTISAKWLTRAAFSLPATDIPSAEVTHNHLIYTYILQPSDSVGPQRRAGDALFRGGDSTFDGTSESYDNIVVAACFQGLINRDSPRLYFLDGHNPRPEFWLKQLSAEGRWLHGNTTHRLNSLDELRELALASENVQRAMDGRGIRTVIVRAPKLVNIVPA